MTLPPRSTGRRSARSCLGADCRSRGGGQLFEARRTYPAACQVTPRDSRSRRSRAGSATPSAAQPRRRGTVPFQVRCGTGTGSVARFGRVADRGPCPRGLRPVARAAARVRRRNPTFRLASAGRSFLMFAGVPTSGNWGASTCVAAAHPGPHPRRAQRSGWCDLGEPFRARAACITLTDINGDHRPGVLSAPDPGGR